MSEMIGIKTNKLNFKFRVSGIVLKDNKVLLVDMDDSGFLCLPGGYVEIGETTQQACLRELSEEIEKEFEIEQYCGVIENFFENKFNKLIHEISFYYKVKPIDDMELKDFVIIEEDNGNTIKLDYKWIDLNELDNFDIRPDFLKIILKNKLNFNHMEINEIKNK